MPTSRSEKLVASVALGYESTEVDTLFNSGEQEVEGISVVPYLAHLLDDNWSTDLALGFSFLDTDQFRTDSLDASRVTSSFNSRRWFFAGNLGYTTSIDNWLLNGRAGLVWARESKDSHGDRWHCRRRQRRHIRSCDRFSGGGVYGRAL